MDLPPPLAYSCTLAKMLKGMDDSLIIQSSYLYVKYLGHYNIANPQHEAWVVICFLDS